MFRHLLPVINTAQGINRQSLQNSYTVKQNVEKGNFEKVINEDLLVMALPGATRARFRVIYVKGHVGDGLRRAVTSLEQWMRNKALSMMAHMTGLCVEDLLCKSRGWKVKCQDRLKNGQESCEKRTSLKGNIQI